VTDRGDTKRPRGRLYAFAAILGLIAVAIVVQLVRLSLVLPSRDGGETVTLPPVQRGSILDRQGRIMAITTRMQRLSAWTPAVTDAGQTASLLAPALGMDRDAILSQLRGRDGYVIVKRRLSDEETAAVQKLKADGKLAGVRLEQDLSRFYPQGRLASHAVGYVGADNVPWDGIEYTFNNELAPQPVGTDTQTVYGDQVFLTIDLDMQYVVDRVARAALEANKADSLTILVMDAPTGEILAYTSLPDFDPNELQKPTPQISAASLANLPLTMAYEPGSVFKVFSLSSFLELKAITPADRFHCEGAYVLTLPSGEAIRIRDLAAHGWVSPQQVIEYSCNTGAADASEKADPEQFYQMLCRFGFGRQTGIPLQGETAGLFAPVSRWSARSKPTIAMGQEVAVSAMQMITAATAIANGGVLLRPQIVRKIVSPQGAVVREFGRDPVADVVSARTARTMLEWMETATLPAGTAHRAAVDGVRISAKTGTAQVANPKTGTYSPDNFVASILGIFPTQDPRLIVYVVIQNPRGQSYYGSQIAAPIFRDVAVGLMDRLGIPRAGTLPAAAPTAAPAAPPDIAEVMPDLTGTPKKLLLPLLLRTDVNVTMTGSGFVFRQSPAPGTRITKGMSIVLELR
jgi:cell division protein FtsI (penicillin-binding protein 3)